MLFGRDRKNPIRLVDKGVVEWKYTTCGYCSTGCSIEVGLDKNGRAVSSRGVGDADVNRGKLCIKGILEHELFTSAGRGQVPLLRERIHAVCRISKTTLSAPFSSSTTIRRGSACCGLRRRS